jgi:hypothetical protein
MARSSPLRWRRPRQVSTLCGCASEFHPGHHELRAGEFRPNHGELGRQSVRCAQASFRSGCCELHAGKLHPACGELGILCPRRDESGWSRRARMSTGGLRLVGGCKLRGWSVHCVGNFFRNCRDERIKRLVIWASHDPPAGASGADGRPISRITV